MKNYKELLKNIEIDVDTYKNLLTQFYYFKLQERELALSKYLEIADMLDTPEKFVLMGKTAATFLSITSEISRDIYEIAKELKNIVIKNQPTETQNNEEELDTSWKQKAIEFLLQNEKDEINE